MGGLQFILGVPISKSFRVSSSSKPFLSPSFRFNLRAYNKPSHNMITRCLTSLLLLLYAVLLVKG